MHDLSVTGDYAYAGALRRVLHRLGDAAQIAHRKTFLQYHGARKKQRLRTAHRKIIDRPIDRELTDVAARKEQRIHYIRVGREGETVAVP